MPLLFHTAGPFSHHLYPSIPFSLPLSLSFTRSLCSPLLHVTSPLSFRFFISFVMPVFACPLLFAFLFVHFSPAPYILFFVKLSSFFHPTLSHNFPSFNRSKFYFSARIFFPLPLLILCRSCLHSLPSSFMSYLHCSFPPFNHLFSLASLHCPSSFLLSFSHSILSFYLSTFSLFLSFCPLISPSFSLSLSFYVSLLFFISVFLSLHLLQFAL